MLNSPPLHAENAWHDLLQGIRELAKPKLRVFISYAWLSDAENDSQQRWAKDLAKDLMEIECDVFLDQFNMHDDMSVKMQQGIENSDAALILCTPALKTRVSLETSVAFELQEILTRKEVSKANFQVLPLIYSGDFKESVPDVLKKYFVRDCSNTGKYKQQLTDLHSPLGIIPGLLGMQEGNEAYKALLARYRLEVISNLPNINPDFCGREMQLKTMAEKWSTSTTHTQIISAFGGMGKTQLTLAYAHRHQYNYKICRWLLSEGEQLKLSVRNFAEELGIDLQGLNDENIIKKLYQALSHYPSWLLVFDNVDDAKTFQAYLPNPAHLSAQQHILITSRSSAWSKQQQVVLGVFSAEDALRYMITHLPDAAEPSLLTLAQSLDYLPLALSQATAYLQASGISVETYLDLFKKQPLVALNEPGIEVDYQRTIQSTLALSLEKICAHPHALLMLNACAWLAADNIPLYIFEHFDLFDSKASVTEALKVLNKYSLVQESKPGYLKIHRLVQCVLRTNKDAVSALILVNKTLKAIYSWDKIKEQDFTRTRDLINHLAIVMEHDEHHIKMQSEFWQEHYLAMNRQLADAYLTFGQPVQTKNLLEHALPIQEKHSGKDHLAVANTLATLGRAYQDLGNPHQSKKLLEQALSINEKYHGSDYDDLAVAAILCNLGRANQALGSKELAKALFERALILQEKCYGQNHISMAMVLINLGNSYGDLDDPLQAIKLFKRALALQEKYYDHDHVDMARTLGNLGVAYYT
ncbi:MAG: toll/interleukin-1 receptor domain-containing protein, partial [Gammaproteobacteria bacterium]|nr:toll/interleukin-1 receptor domain-containing protein [Gammaproteobacteria bacterium]